MKKIPRQNPLCKPICGRSKSPNKCYIINPEGIPTVMTGLAVNVLESSATIANNTFSEIPGTINYAAIAYSTSPTMVSAATRYGAAASPFSVDLTELQPDTTYYYRAAVESTIGLYLGQVRSFQTSQAMPPRVVITGDATNITPESMTIINNTFSGFPGTVDFAAVEYGTSPTMSGAAMGFGAIGSPFSVNLTGLQYNTTYYYRAAVGASANQYYGQIKSATTPNLT